MAQCKAEHQCVQTSPMVWYCQREQHTKASGHLLDQSHRVRHTMTSWKVKAKRRSPDAMTANRKEEA